jgi:hypothetical protein
MRWFKWFKKPTQQPRAKRIPVDSLAAVYWDGSVNCLHAVKDVSLTGALIETSLNWSVGTRVRMSLQYLGKGGAESLGTGPAPVHEPGLELVEKREAVDQADVFIDVWSRVARQTAKGLSVEFIFPDRREAQRFRRFLESKVGEYVKEPHQLTPATSLQRTGAH